VGNYPGFNTYVFLNSLDHPWIKCHKVYSTPKSSGSVVALDGGGGGFPGGGFWRGWWQ